MTHDQKGLEAQRDGPETTEQDKEARYAVSAVFGESELKQMSGVLDAVCEKLNIKRDGADARAAALAVLDHMSQGYSDAQALKDAVIENLRQQLQKSPA